MDQLNMSPVASYLRMRSMHIMMHTLRVCIMMCMRMSDVHPEE